MSSIRLNFLSGLVVRRGSQTPLNRLYCSLACICLEVALLSNLRHEINSMFFSNPFFTDFAIA